MFLVFPHQTGDNPQYINKCWSRSRTASQNTQKVKLIRRHRIKMGHWYVIQFMLIKCGIPSQIKLQFVNISNIMWSCKQRNMVFWRIRTSIAQLLISVDHMYPNCSSAFTHPLLPIDYTSLVQCVPHDALWCHYTTYDHRDLQICVISQLTLWLLGYMNGIFIYIFLNSS